MTISEIDDFIRAHPEATHVEFDIGGGKTLKFPIVRIGGTRRIVPHASTCASFGCLKCMEEQKEWDKNSAPLKNP